MNGTLHSFAPVDCCVAACSADDRLAASIARVLESLLSPASSVESGPCFMSLATAYTLEFLSALVTVSVSGVAGHGSDGCSFSCVAF